MSGCKQRTELMGWRREAHCVYSSSALGGRAGSQKHTLRQTVKTIPPTAPLTPPQAHTHPADSCKVTLELISLLLEVKEEETLF